ncbi:MAG TPA: radical SAM protein [Candidatus Omnitrophica bacterium]|nr:MAG: hypothetical protein A2Y04_05285 [Omnitrophica WOR_2 bacterium GWC2_45_7]HBR15701.1 radical SAM protein [Candidatus Omnitrophota bacterium]
MEPREFKYIYGPVYSWRLGMSLGIDPVTQKSKICNFDCVYCQLGRTVQWTTQREEFVSVDAIMEEIHALAPMAIDYYTFSGRGEPTLAKNLGAMIQALRQAGKGKIAVITNAALIDQPDVQKDLSLADFVLVKLDACDQASLEAIDVPASGITFLNIVDGIKSFQRNFSGRLALQMMFMAGNISLAARIAELAREIRPDEIQLNTPLRPSVVSPVSEEELKALKKHFTGLPVVTVYEAERKEARPLDDKATVRRHGNFKKGKVHLNAP